MHLSLLPSPGAPARLQAAARRRPLVLIAAGVVLYSIGPVLAQASGVSGPVFSFWRLWIGVPLLGVAAMAAGRRSSSRPTAQGLRWTMWAGAAFGVHQLLFLTAIKATSVTDVALMNTLAPVVIAVAAARMFGERPGARFRLWTVLAMLGAAVVIAGGATGPEGDPVGMGMAAANVVAFGAFFLLSKQARDDIDVLPFLFGVVLIAAVTVSVAVALLDAPVLDVGRRDLWLAFGVAAGPGALGHFVMTWPLRWVPANVPPVLRLAQPLVAGGLAYLALGEPVTAAHLLGGAITLAGVAGAVLAHRRTSPGLLAMPAGGGVGPPPLARP